MSRVSVTRSRALRAVLAVSGLLAIGGHATPAEPRDPNPSAVACEATMALQTEHSDSLLVGLWRTARPRQWVKNVLLLAAPFGAGVITDADALVRTGLAFVLFC